ncbi:MAG: STE24 endopeptidase [Planctomycetota bacterium]|jgi:STE24 endopeptidase
MLTATPKTIPMNLYATIILVALVLEFVVNRIGDFLNLRSLNPELPSEFAETYDGEKYANSQDYTRATTRFRMVEATFSLGLTLVFWLGGGFTWLDEFSRGLEKGPIVTGLIFMLILMVALKLLNLPFQLWSTFKIEERFGFNRMTPKTFWSDQFKGIVLGGILGGGLMSAILFFFVKTGDVAWLWCWGTTTIVTLVGMFIAPTWIMPLFNKFTKLDEGELRDEILEYANKVSFPLEGLFVIDGSKRSSKANAFFTGFGKTKRIALYDTLIEAQSTDELVAVVAHEIGHYKRKHILKSLVIGILHFGVMFGLLSIFLKDQRLFDAFGVAEPSVHAGLIFFSMLLTPVELVLSVLMSYISRKNEFEADAFAAQTTGQPEDLVTALKKLSSDNLSNLTPHDFYVWLHYSHPPVLRRIAALRAIG